MDKKIGFFDVDKTLIKIDSMFKLLFYTLKRKPRAILGLPRLFIMLVAYGLKLIGTKKAKEEMFYIIKYLSEEDLEEFFYKIVAKAMFKEADYELKKLKKEGYTIILASASPECYLKHFKKLYEVDYVIGTVLETKEGKYLNIIQGQNCKGEEKVRRILKLLEQEGFSINKEESAAYSDSLSDMPMLNLARNKYLINNKKIVDDCVNLRWN